MASKIECKCCEFHCMITLVYYNNYTLCFDNNVHCSSLLIANCSCGPDCKCTGQCERGCCSCICNGCDGSPCQRGESCKCDMKECCETVKCTTCSKFVSIIVDLINFTQCFPPGPTEDCLCGPKCKSTSDSQGGCCLCVCDGCAGEICTCGTDCRCPKDCCSSCQKTEKSCQNSSKPLKEVL